MPARMRILMVAPAAVLALALAACGGGSNGDDGQPARPGGTLSPTAAPGTGTGGAVSASVAPVPTSKGATVSGASLSARMNAAIAKAGSARFSIVVTGPQPSSAKGVTAGTGDNLKLDMKAALSSTSKIEIIKISGNVYLKMPTAIDGEKSWLEITNKPNDPFKGFYTSTFQSLEVSADVGRTSAAIAQIGTFTVGATEKVGGVTTIKYTASPPAATGVKLLPASFQDLGTDTMNKSKTAVAVWIDARGLVRQVATQLTLPATATGSKAKSLVTYQDWGTSVSVQAPPSSQVTSATPAS